MTFLAVTTGLDKIKAAPPAFWWKLGLGIGGLIVLVFVIKKLAEVNKMVLAVIAMIIITVVGVNWVYERNEPKFMSPLIDKIAPFLPSKGAYNEKQTKTPDQLKPSSGPGKK